MKSGLGESSNAHNTSTNSDKMKQVQNLTILMNVI